MSLKNLSNPATDKSNYYVKTQQTTSNDTSIANTSFVKNAITSSVGSSIFNILSVQYPANQQFNLLLGNSTTQVVNGIVAYIDTSVPPETLAGVTGYNQFKVSQDGLYLMTLQLNNDYTGTANTICGCTIYLYYNFNGNWAILYSNDRTYPERDQTNTINGSVVIDTKAIGSKTFAWNIQPTGQPFTYQFAQITMLCGY